MQQEKLQLTGGGNKFKRRELDFYPTPFDCTVALMNFLKIKECLKILEPCCGCGSISEVLKSYRHNVDSYDLQLNLGYGIGGVDYLKNDFLGYDAIITNPPFNLSDQFIKKALSEASIVAFLLKSQYWHSKKRYTLLIEKPPAYILPLTWRPNFDPNKGNSPTMEVLWTVWIKDNKNSKYIPLLKPNKNSTLFPLN